MTSRYPVSNSTSYGKPQLHSPLKSALKSTGKRNLAAEPTRSPGELIKIAEFINSETSSHEHRLLSSTAAFSPTSDTANTVSSPHLRRAAMRGHQPNSNLRPNSSSKIGGGLSVGGGGGQHHNTSIYSPRSQSIANQTSSSLKERKFSLLYRDVLDCASHVLRSKEEFQEKYRETQDRVGKTEISMRDMILEVEETCKSKLLANARSFETKILTAQEYFSKTLDAEKVGRQTDVEDLHKKLEAVQGDLKQWSADFVREVAARCDAEIQHVDTAAREKQTNLEFKLHHLSDEVVLPGLEKSAKLVEKWRNEFGVDLEKKFRILQTQLHKLEDDRSLDRKVVDEIEELLEKRTNAIEEKAAFASDANEKDLAEVRERLRYLETKRLPELEAEGKCKHEFLAEKLQQLEGKQGDFEKQVSTKIENEVSHICDAMEALKQKQDAVNKKISNLMKERFELVQKESSDNLKTQWEKTEQRVQAALEFTKHEYVQPLQIDCGILRKDLEEVSSVHGNKLEGLFADLTELSKQYYGSEESGEAWRKKKAEEDKMRLHKLTQSLKEVEAKLSGEIAVLTDTSAVKTSQLTENFEKKVGNLGTLLELAKKEFRSEVKKCGSALHDQMDFKIESVEAEMEKVKQAESKLQEQLRAQEQGLLNQAEANEEKLQECKDQMQQQMEGEKVLASENLEKQIGLINAAIEGVKSQLTEDIAEWTGSVENKMQAEGREVKEKLGKIGGQVSSLAQKQEAAAKDVAKLGDASSQNNAAALTKLKNLEKRQQVAEKDLQNLTAEDSNLQAAVEQTNVRVRKFVEEQIRVFKSEEAEKIFELKQKQQHAETETHRIFEKFSTQVFEKLLGVETGSKNELKAVKDGCGKGVENLKLKVLELETKIASQIEGVEKQCVSLMAAVGGSSSQHQFTPSARGSGDGNGASTHTTSNSFMSPTSIGNNAARNGVSGYPKSPVTGTNLLGSSRGRDGTTSVGGFYPHVVGGANSSLNSPSIAGAASPGRYM
eukprot:g3992.t1